MKKIFNWRREWDSNPRPLSESLVFKTSSLNHSDTSPYWFSLLFLSSETFVIILRSVLFVNTFLKFFIFSFVCFVFSEAVALVYLKIILLSTPFFEFFSFFSYFSKNPWKSGLFSTFCKLFYTLWFFSLKNGTIIEMVLQFLYTVKTFPKQRKEFFYIMKSVSERFLTYIKQPTTSAQSSNFSLVIFW